MTIGLHDNIYSEGSALPIYDDKSKYINLGLGAIYTDELDLNSDTKVANKNAFSVLFGAEYTFDEHNQVGVEFDFFTCDKTKAFAVPVFWKWTM